jgi:hypothetical protein
LEELNKWTCLTYLGVARALGVSVWRVRYAVASGYLSPPSVVLKKRRLFSPAQVDDMRAFFEKEAAARGEVDRAKVTDVGDGR